MEVPEIECKVIDYLTAARRRNLVKEDIDAAMLACRKALEAMVKADYKYTFGKKEKFRPLGDMLELLKGEEKSRFSQPLVFLMGRFINQMTRGDAHDDESRHGINASTQLDVSQIISNIMYLFERIYGYRIESHSLEAVIDEDDIDRGLKEAITYGSGEHEDEMISKGVLEVADLIDERGGQLGYRELRETGMAAQRIGQFEVAIGQYRQALRTLENDDGDLREILTLRACIADVKMSLGELEDAKIDYQKIIEDYRNHPIMNPPPPDDMEIVLLQKLAQVQILTSTYISREDKIREALPLLLEAEEIHGKKEPSQSYVLLLHRIAQNYEALGEEKKASEYNERWKECLVEIIEPHPETLIDSDSPIARLITAEIIETDLDLEEKLGTINYFLDRAKAENNRLREISITNEIANIHLKAGDREKAAEYLRICIDFYRKHGGGEGPAHRFEASFRLLQILDEDSPEYQELLAETEELVEDNPFFVGKQALLGLTRDGGEVDQNSDPEQKISRMSEGIYLLEALHREPEPKLEKIAGLSEALGSHFLSAPEDREILSGIMTRDDALGYLREALEIHKSLDSDTEVIQKLYEKLLGVYMVGMEPNSVDGEDLSDYWFSLVHDEMLYFQQIGKTSEFSQHLNEFLGANPLLGRVLRSTDFGQELFGIPGILEKLEDPDISASMKEKYQAHLDGIFEPSFRRSEVRYEIRLPFKIVLSLFPLTILTIASSLLYYLLMISNLGNLVTTVGVIILLPLLIISLGGVIAFLPIWRRTQNFEHMTRLGLMEVDEESNSVRITRLGMIALGSVPAIDEE